MIKEINIYIKNKNPLKDLYRIINASKKEGAKEWSNVYFHLKSGDQDVKNDLGTEYQIYELERKRIIETPGVIKVECC